MLRNRVKRHRAIKRLVKRHLKDVELNVSSGSQMHSNQDLLSHSVLDSTAECSGVTDDTNVFSAMNDSDNDSSNSAVPRSLEGF